MNIQTLNNALKLSYPDGFHTVEGQEREKLCFLEDGSGICLSDPERHILVTVAWKEIGGFASLLLGRKDLAKDMEARVKKAMQPFGYRLERFSKREIGGKKSEGFCCGYTARDVGMYAESYVVKEGKTLYYFHLYVRAALKEESLTVWEDVLDAVEWL